MGASETHNPGIRARHAQRAMAAEQREGQWAMNKTGHGTRRIRPAPGLLTHGVASGSATESQRPFGYSYTDGNRRSVF